MWLTVRAGGELGSDIEVLGERVLIGRDPSCDLVLSDDRVSRQHIALRSLPDGTVELRDLGSSNGTLVDGARVTEPVVLRGGERLQLGGALLEVSRGRSVGTATVVGAAVPEPDAAARGPSPSTIERRRLRRSARLGIIAGGAGAAGAIAIGVLVAAGVIGGGGNDDDGRLEIPEIVERVTPSTVVVTALVDREQQGTGTGWVLDAGQGLIVTNQHVTNGGAEFSVGVGSSQRPARLVGAAPCDDLALLEVEDSAGLQTLPLGRQDELRPGQTVIAVGFPGSASESAQLTTTTGVVSVVRSRFDLRGVDVPQYQNVIQTDAAINPGNSGGPLVDEQAELVGVNSAGITLLGGRTIQGQGYAIGVDRVREVVPQLRAGRSISWTGMGFVFVPDAEEAQAQLEGAGLPALEGLVVTHAVPGTAAAEAGFGEAPTLILGIDGERIDGTLASYCSAVGESGAGDSAVFTIARPGATEPEDVTVSFE